MAKKDERFNLRLTTKELNALNRLAMRQGLDRSKLITGMIRRAAKRKKVWECDS